MWPQDIMDPATDDFERRRLMKKIIILSGGFDPVHKGHVEMFKAASFMADEVVVGLNSDDWLTRKKGKPFMDFDERKFILESIEYIDYVFGFDDSDDTACDVLRKVNQLYNTDTSVQVFFGNGGDRTDETTPEIKYCKQNGIGLLFGVGGGKIQSSSDLIANANKEK
tara:strand:+ start:4451 stop:4951 length:501 start_codon:yes stop_codon:yes gene_type:complete